MVHISNLCWQIISHPSDVVWQGQKIKVMVLDIDEDKKRIALGLNHVTLHPSYGIAGHLREGDIVKGKVSGVSVNGLHVEIMPGAGGFVHRDQISWSKYGRTPQEAFGTGDEIQACIISIDRQAGRILLSKKQLVPDPNIW